MRISVIAAVAALSAGAANAATINLDGVANASLDGSTGVTLTLGPGDYTVAPIIDDYVAFNRWGHVDACFEYCMNGWEHSYRVIIGATEIGFGPNAGLGGPGPFSDHSYYATAAQAFAAAQPASPAFTLSATTQVTFYIYDNYLDDNLGGISLEIEGAGVPEPTTWATMLAGLALVGTALRRRRPDAVVSG